jgi:hypothetical protein
MQAAKTFSWLESFLAKEIMIKRTPNAGFVRLLLVFIYWRLCIWIVFEVVKRLKSTEWIEVSPGGH